MPLLNALIAEFSDYNIVQDCPLNKGRISQNQVLCYKWDQFSNLFNGFVCTVECDKTLQHYCVIVMMS